MPTVADYIRPSALAGLAQCTAKARMEAQALTIMPWMDATSPAAAEGTAGHAVIAQTLALIYQQQDGRNEPEAALARMASAMDGLAPWTRDAVRRCVAYAVALVDQAERQRYRVSILIELHLPGSSIGIARGGTADLVLLLRDEMDDIAKVIVCDWKLGYLDQGAAADHLQLGAYAVMAADKYQPTGCVEVHLGQGRLKDFSAASYTLGQLDMLRDCIRTIVTDAMDTAQQPHPHIDACRYCRALPYCRAAHAYVQHALDTAAMFGTAPDTPFLRRFCAAIGDVQQTMRTHPASDMDTGNPWLTPDTDASRADLLRLVTEATHTTQGATP